jgi:hypothetical protein
MAADMNGSITISWSDGVDPNTSNLQIFPEDFGAVGDGTTNDTAALTAAINAANTSRVALYGKPGATYTVTPGALPVMTQSMFFQDSFFEAADTTDDYLIAWELQHSRPNTNGGPYSFTVDIGGLMGVNNETLTQYGTGLWVKGAQQCKFRVRYAAWLKYNVHVDVSWNTTAPVNAIYENEFWIKGNSSTVNLQLSTSTDADCIPLADNKFFLSNSFNHKTANIRCSAGTTIGCSEISNNTFIMDLLEIPLANSDGMLS